MLIIIVCLLCLAIWGLDANGHFLADAENRGSLMQRVLKTIFRDKTGGGASGSVAQRVLMDLQSVHCDLVTEETYMNDRATNKERGTRLMYLFQRDLLPGISGKILESKGQRDNIAVKQVALE